VARGQLIGESLRVGASLRGVKIRLLGVTRVEPPVANLAASQPRVWTFIGFEVDDADAPALAATLATVLEPGPWYCNLLTADEMWVAFAGKVFRYPLGDVEGRSAARAYARLQGVPEPQLDWD
jgi:hypothetical protein